MTNDSLPNHIVRVLVVDDQRLMRDGIVSLLEMQDGIEVVAQLLMARKPLRKPSPCVPTSF